MKPYCRPFNDERLIEHFVINILEIRNTAQCKKAIKSITNAELQMAGIKDNNFTLNSDSYRDLEFKNEEKRIELRKRIFEELIKFERLEKDDKIKLGTGGALPKDKKIKSEKQAFLLIGLPASGKSTVTNKISDYYGAVILDCDYAKRKLPEYNKTYIGASLVHNESNLIVFGKKGSNELNVLEYCCMKGYNIVIPKIGHDLEDVLDFTKNLKELGYDVHITLVSLDRKKATQRAYCRFIESKRYVPLNLIFDWYSNEPIITYYRLKDNNIYSSYGAISTDVGINEPFICKEYNFNNPAKLFSI